MSRRISPRSSANPVRPDACERATFWLFRSATYFVLAADAAVFPTLSSRGAGTVFKTEAPFINTAFLTEAPESLYVFE
jgi:phosphate transport system permease protein